MGTTNDQYCTIFLRCLKNWVLAGQWWHTPLIPALGRQRQADLCDLSRPAWSTRASSRTGSKATEKPCLEKKNTKKTLGLAKCGGAYF